MQNGPKALRLARAITARPARGLRGDTAARDLPPSPRCSRVPMTAAAIASSSSAASGLRAFNPSQERIRQLTVISDFGDVGIDVLCNGTIRFSLFSLADPATFARRDHLRMASFSSCSGVIGKDSDSLAKRPHSGLSMQQTDAAPKRLEPLREIIPEVASKGEAFLI